MSNKIKQMLITAVMLAVSSVGVFGANFQKKDDQKQRPPRDPQVIEQKPKEPPREEKKDDKKDDKKEDKKPK